jgi:hypothetical protein
VLGFFHVLKEAAEMHETGHVGLVKLDAPRVAELARHRIRCRRSRVADFGVLRQKQPPNQHIHLQEAVARQHDGLRPRGREDVASGDAMGSRIARTLAPYFARSPQAGCCRLNCSTTSRISRSSPVGR